MCLIDVPYIYSSLSKRVVSSDLGGFKGLTTGGFDFGGRGGGSTFNSSSEDESSSSEDSDDDAGGGIEWGLGTTLITGRACKVFQQTIKKNAHLLAGVSCLLSFGFAGITFFGVFVDDFSLLLFFLSSDSTVGGNCKGSPASMSLSPFRIGIQQLCDDDVKHSGWYSS